MISQPPPLLGVKKSKCGKMDLRSGIVGQDEGGGLPQPALVSPKMLNWYTSSKSGTQKKRQAGKQFSAISKFKGANTISEGKGSVDWFGKPQAG